jgi:NOL1/NOP2/fmu family ribosome biogenesis protein
MDWAVLTSKDIRAVHAQLEEQFGFAGKLDYAFLKNHENNLYMVTRDVSLVDWKKLHVTSMGSYFAEQKKGLRLSIEGSQLVGPNATKNVFELKDEEVMPWLKGHDLSTKSPLVGLVIVRHKNDYFGCGSVKEGILLNFVPKIRRLPAQA